MGDEVGGFVIVGGDGWKKGAAMVVGMFSTVGDVGSVAGAVAVGLTIGGAPVDGCPKVIQHSKSNIQYRMSIP